MKVDFGTQNVNQNVDKEKIAYSTPGQKDSARIAEQAAGYTIDISGTVMDNAAYGKEELKSSKDIMQDAGQTDIALQRDYMAVMSNSMSTEDFAKLQKDGYSPADTEIETQVTVVDEIKAALLEAGVVVEGYNDDLSKEELSEITGNTMRAEQIEKALKDNNLPVTEDNVQQMNQALDKASGMKPLSEDTLKYMLNNKLEPTIENLYKAEYSTGAGYYEKKADTIDWEQIQDQMTAIIEKAGLRADEQTMNQAKWVVEKGIPLTEETLQQMNVLKELTFPMEDTELLNVMAKAITNGKTPEQASLLEKESIAEKAVLLIKETDAISEESVKTVIDSGKELTVYNLSKCEEQQSLLSDSDPKLIKAMRLLEETRLQMTIQANIKLLRQGVSIDTVPLEKLVEQLKAAEQEYYRPFLESQGTDKEADGSTLSEKISLYKETGSLLEQIKSIPSAVLGRLSTNRDSLTLSAVYQEGTALKSAYEKAGSTYEALMTSPRADMGDSIKKAFRNADELLEEMGFEVNETNRKAVRILGYSRMEINKANVEAVRSAEQAVTNVIEKMTPAKTLQMIRAGENPLQTNIYELSNQLGEKGAEEQAEKYSEFLWKLEKNDEISVQERAAFIGVYRLFNQIEKSDGKLIGNVINSGESLTLNNLLSAYRTNRTSGVDAVIDDNFGGLSELVQMGDTISSQIEMGFQTEARGSSADDSSQQYYNNLAKEVFDKLTPESLLSADISTHATLEAFAEEIRQGSEDETLNREYLREQLSDIRAASEIEDSVLKALRDSEQPGTVNNLLAANQLINVRGSTYEKLSKQINNSKSEQKEKVRKAMEDLPQKLTSKEEANSAYEEMTASAKSLLSEDMQSAVHQVDVREMNLLYKQLSVAAGFAKNENYEVPVQIEGEWTSVHLKIIRNSDESGKVSATMETEQYGKIAAQFSVNENQVNGYISGEDEEGLKKLSEKAPEMKAALAGETRTVGELNYIPAKTIDFHLFNRETANKETKTPMKELYEVAKAFITVLQQKGETANEN